MTVKTLTIKESSYEALKSLKHEDESFSDVIDRISGQKLRIKDLFGILKKTSAEHEILQKHLRKIREEISKDAEERINRVRSRHISTN